MRIVENKSISKRIKSSEVLDYRRIQYFFALEGMNTECAYFNGLANTQYSFKIKSRIEVKIIKREEHEAGLSNPTRVLAEYNNQKKDIFKDVEFVEGLDKICFVFDRDSQSLRMEQYDLLLQNCENNGIELYIVNPFFEFWLLLHFANHDDLDRGKLMSDGKYIINELKRYLPSYNKDTKLFDFNEIKLNNIERAVENSRCFCQELSGIKTKTGTNLGILMEELRANQLPV